MKKNIMMALVVILAAMLILSGCSRNGNTTGNSSIIGPGKTAKNTVSAVLTNTEYPSGIQVNWSSRIGNSAVTLSGLQQLAIVVDGDEIIDGIFEDKSLTSIKLELTGQTSGKKVTLDTSLIGVATNLGADSDYFKVDGNTFYFYPHYFSVGEQVTVKTTFTYKADGVINQMVSGDNYKGYLIFTVGEDTQETFSNPLSDFSKSIKNFFDGLGDSSGNNNDDSGITTGGFTWGNNSGSFFEDVEYLIEGHNRQIISKYEADSQSNPINLKDQWLDMTVYTRESPNHDIVKVYLELPDGTNIVWSNDWFEDNCHKFLFDMSAYSGQTVTIRIRLLAGSELWQDEFMYGFITVQVP